MLSLLLLLLGSAATADSASMTTEIPAPTPTPIDTPTFTLRIKDVVSHENIYPRLSLISVILLTVVGCVVVGVLLLVVIPGLRQDLAPLLE